MTSVTTNIWVGVQGEQRKAWLTVEHDTWESRGYASAVFSKRTETF